MKKLIETLTVDDEKKDEIDVNKHQDQLHITFTDEYNAAHF